MKVKITCTMDPKDVCGNIYIRHFLTFSRECLSYQNHTYYCHFLVIKVCIEFAINLCQNPAMFVVQPAMLMMSVKDTCIRASGDRWQLRWPLRI